MDVVLETNQPKPSAPRRWLVVCLLILSAFGFIDATYLTSKHFLGSPITCSILHGCEQVTTSVYSLVLGLPVALFGSLFYLTVLILSAVYLQNQKKLPLIIITLLSTLAFLVSLRFVYLQLFIIKAICIFCMGSATTSTLLFILSLASLKKTPAV